MYPIDPAESPVLATAPVVTDAMIDQMNADLADVRRNDAAIGEADLIAMYEAQQAEEIMPVEWHRQRILQSIREFRQAVRREIERVKPAAKASPIVSAVA